MAIPVKKINEYDLVTKLTPEDKIIISQGKKTYNATITTLLDTFGESETVVEYDTTSITEEMVKNYSPLSNVFIEYDSISSLADFSFDSENIMDNSEN